MISTVNRISKCDVLDIDMTLVVNITKISRKNIFIIIVRLILCKTLHRNEHDDIVTEME